MKKKYKLSWVKTVFGSPLTIIIRFKGAIFVYPQTNRGALCTVDENIIDALKIWKNFGTLLICTFQYWVSNIGLSSIATHLVISL